MSSWFDKWHHEDSEVACAFPARNTDEEFLERVREIEQPRVHAINLVTGDREFPDDLREKIQGIIARWSLSGSLPPSERVLEYVLSVRNSELSMKLHSAFHEVARRHIETRFGRLSDSPSQILALRDDYDESRANVV